MASSASFLKVVLRWRFSRQLPQIYSGAAVYPTRSCAVAQWQHPPSHRFGHRALIAAADTFFIATAYLDPSAGAAKGVDVSHRGGKQGFVKISGEVLTVPDFAGNCHFNTFGNIELNPRAGLLFLDFNSGDLLYLPGRAEVIWESEEIGHYPGAERLFRCHLLEGYFVTGSLPISWTSPEFSPFLSETGDWSVP
jgi:hypothetical protein